MRLGKLGVWRHIVAGFAVLVVTLLAAAGVIGRGSHPERFDAKTVTITPAGNDGLRLREVVDEDFGSKDRHGYERNLPLSFGEPTDIEASSPDANADVGTALFVDKLRVRLGSKNKTYTGQHRYILSYTYPNAGLSSGSLNLDVIGTDETFETGRFEVIVAGMQLSDVACNVGSFGATGGCTLAKDGDVYRAVIAPLKPGEGINIRGTVVGRSTVPTIDDPAVPARRPDRRGLMALLSLVLGTAGVIGSYLYNKRSGRNEVFAGGAADAAYGSLPDPSASTAQRPVRLVADTDMDELATIEFVPPKGIEPWQGSVLLSERINDKTVAAYISGMAAKDAISLTKEDGSLVLRRGVKYQQMDASTQSLIDDMLGGSDELTLGTYHASFAKAWRQILADETEQIANSGWWKRFHPGGGASAMAIVIIVFIAFFFFGSAITALIGLFRSFVPGLLFAILVPLVIANLLYGLMRSQRSATGSALTLRTESFRRFLEKSEGRHVDWAWKQGLLREYSAWAVALDAADAWGKALAHSNVPPAEVANFNAPLLVYSMGSAFSGTRIAPSSSSGGGSSFGGGFSGGVGGGGGGGSSGSW